MTLRPMAHRAGGHGAVVAGVELAPPPARGRNGSLSRGTHLYLWDLRFGIYEVEWPAGKWHHRPRPPPPSLQYVVVPLVVGRAGEGVDAAAQQDCPGADTQRKRIAKKPAASVQNCHRKKRLLVQNAKIAQPPRTVDGPAQ
jgi:hypothetical protein